MENQSIYTNTKKTLDEWNQELVDILMPYTIVLIVYSILGLLGNSIVIYIYFVKFKTYSVGRFFIPVLAVVDLVACVVNCAGNITDTLLLVTYQSAIGCKIQRYLCLSTTIVSMLILLLIVIDRYLKICRPLGRQMDRKWKKRSIGIVIATAIVISAPYLHFTDALETESENSHLIGRTCKSSPSGIPKIYLAYLILFLVLIIGEMIAMSVLYILICRVVFKKPNFETCGEKSSAHKSQLHSRFANEDDMSITASEADVSTHIMELRGFDDHVDHNKSSGTHSHSANQTAPCSFNEVSETHPSTVEKRPKGILTGMYNNPDKKRWYTTSTASNVMAKRRATHRNHGNIHRSRILIMFIVITVAFAICFIPKVVMMVLDGVMGLRNSRFTVRNSDLVSFFTFLHLFYIVNNFVNPFIYGCMDKKFQLELKSLCCINRSGNV